MVLAVGANSREVDDVVRPTTVLAGGGAPAGHQRVVQVQVVLDGARLPAGQNLVVVRGTLKGVILNGVRRPQLGTQRLGRPCLPQHRLSAARPSATRPATRQQGLLIVRPPAIRMLDVVLHKVVR